MVAVPRLFLIDSFGFIFRAYHARARSGAPPMRTSSGISTEAVYIFHNMLRKLKTQYKPEYLTAIFESLGPTFRDEAFAQYKANRSETPPDLLSQIPWIRKTLETLRIPILESDRFEADDVIGTLARRAAARGLDVVIVSSDKDMLQLVDDHTSMLNPMKDDMWYDASATEQFMGVKPPQIADLLALMGDTVDNIPGAPGIGEKGARDLIVRFGSVEGALEHAAEVERKTYRESLQNNREQILLSKKLATIHTDVPVDLNLEALAAQGPDTEALRQLYRTLEFTSLLRDLGPSQPSGPRDYQTLESAAFEDWLIGLPENQPLAIAAGGGMGETVVACCAARGIARSCVRSEIPERASVCHDLKSLIRRFGEARGIEHDVLLYGFLLCADPGACDMTALSERFLEESLEADPASHADAVLKLFCKLRPEIETAQLEQVYSTIDLPLVYVLARMEETGILIDPRQLMVLSGRMEDEIARISADIYELAGKTFNINSPQQLGKVLFEDLKLPAPVKYGKGKTISTAAGVLEELAAEYPIAQKVLDFRQLAKLKGTYVDALPALIDPKSGRLHTTFNQAGAATGRLSSSDPNLQNIPIRTALGREIRAAFVPRPGWKLVVADYSQIELRLLAHMSRDPVLVEAFVNGEDIHTRTAAEVFGVPPLTITPEQRRRAKAVNFGIVYGQSPFGLAQSLGIDRKEAETYIRAYFERYAGVRNFIEETKAEVRRTGYAYSLMGRRRPIPDMNSRNFTARGFAERTAVNTPLQSSAADMIKLAMIRIDEKLRSMQAKLLLQVHDELVFEAPPEEVDRVRSLAKQEMEGVQKLHVPLLVDVGAGDNWRDAK
ncbi:MAG: DNA polymerase I [Bryobacterales bacterium]|nr:DNA polymerase I [Bryobacterales bacterium]MBV9399589.1 DNA polymerase I [Bryobacterales bacterium]